MLWLRVAGLLAAATVVTATRGTDVAPSVQLLRLPDGGIQPQAAVDRSGDVHVVFFRGDPGHGDIFYMRLSRAGRSASETRVNSDPGTAIATGRVRGAHIAIGRNGRVHVAWVGSDRTHTAGDPAPILYSRLTDDGRSFEPQRNLMRIPAIGPDGASLAADGAGGVYVFWHALPRGGKGEGERRLWLASSHDDGRTFGEERPVSDPALGACACCGSAAFASEDGTVYVLFRSAREGVHRDSFLLRSTDRGATFHPMDVGPWDINACPMSTYAFAPGLATGPVAALETDALVHWIRPAGGNGWSSLPVGGEVRNQKHPTIARNARGETLVAWTEASGWGKGGTLAWQVFDKDLSRLGEPGRASGMPAWGLAAAVANADGSFTLVY
jgi:hypothetical protein